ncbi:acyltransferase [Haloarchaeobius sp. TZWWS8]|uniref:acyltransferase n=1 Tax=Haloarchaeobius sp. TZWWS8 TaxID=3446121 RepID=UPI003EBD5B40
MRERIHSIDTLRAIAVFFVVTAHVQPFRGFGTYGNYVYFVLDTLGQFDVPFFFLTSGYFLAATLTAENVASKVLGTARKLGSLYLFGRILSVTAVVVIALVASEPVASTLVDGLASYSLLDVLYYGKAAAVPTWFLTALLFSIVFVSLFVRVGKTRYLLPVAALFHVVGLLGTNFQLLVHVPFRTRDALFFGFFYVALGYTFNTVDWSPSEDRSQLYLGAVVALAGVQLLEQYAIGYVIRENTLSQELFLTEYTISTVFFVVAVFAYALSNPQLGRDTSLPSVGRHALGIYLLHVPVFRLIHATRRFWEPAIGFDPTGTLLWQLAIVPVVYVLSLTVYRFMDRVGVIETDGSHIPFLHRIRAGDGLPGRRAHSSDE